MRTMIFALFSDTVYQAEDDKGRTRDKITHSIRMLSQKYPELRLMDWSVIPVSRAVMVMKNDKLKQISVVFRGTEHSNMLDMGNNVQIAVGLEPGRAAWGTELVKNFMAKYPGYKTIVTGHSLGGTITEAVCKKLQTKVIGYSFSTGVSPMKLVSPTANVRALWIEGDIIAFLGQGRRTRLRCMPGEHPHMMAQYIRHYEQGTLPS